MAPQNTLQSYAIDSAWIKYWPGDHRTHKYNIFQSFAAWMDGTVGVCNFEEHWLCGNSYAGAPGYFESYCRPATPNYPTVAHANPRPIWQCADNMSTHFTSAYIGCLATSQECLQYLRNRSPAFLSLNLMCFLSVILMTNQQGGLHTLVRQEGSDPLLDSKPLYPFVRVTVFFMGAVTICSCFYVAALVLPNAAPPVAFSNGVFLLNGLSWVVISILLILDFFCNSSGRKSKSMNMTVSQKQRGVNIKAALIRQLPTRRPAIPILGRSTSRPSRNRFSESINLFEYEAPVQSAGSLRTLLSVDERWQVPRDDDGVNAIRDEIRRYGTRTDKECLEYVLKRPAGSSSKFFDNSKYPRDHDASGVRSDRLRPDGNGMTLEDFVNHPESVRAELKLPHVLALRLYSTAAYKSLNEPLRPSRRRKHPMPATMYFLHEGIKRLRKNQVASPPADGRWSGIGNEQELWRGMPQVRIDQKFLRQGGTFAGVMSTTTNMDKAVEYSASREALVLRLRVDRSTPPQVGASIAYLSAYDEDEVLYPSLTFLKPSSQPITYRFADDAIKQYAITVVDVQPMPFSQ